MTPEYEILFRQFRTLCSIDETVPIKIAVFHDYYNYLKQFLKGVFNIEIPDNIEIQELEEIGQRSVFPILFHTFALEQAKNQKFGKKRVNLKKTYYFFFGFAIAAIWAEFLNSKFGRAGPDALGRSFSNYLALRQIEPNTRMFDVIEADEIEEVLEILKKLLINLFDTYQEDACKIMKCSRERDDCVDSIRNFINIDNKKLIGFRDCLSWAYHHQKHAVCDCKLLYEELRERGLVGEDIEVLDALQEIPMEKYMEIANIGIIDGNEGGLRHSFTHVLRADLLYNLSLVQILDPAQIYVVVAAKTKKRKHEHFLRTFNVRKWANGIELRCYK